MTRSLLRNIALCCVLVTYAAAVHVGHNVTTTSSLIEKETPHLCMPGVQQITGYFNINPQSTKKYFYWFFESQSSPSTDPVILWLTGGPGCSGELALFMENGPCTVNATGTFINPYSWNTKANVIYVDQPAGTGFSTADQSGYDTDEEGVGRDMRKFLCAFFSKHTEYINNQFYIFGESYGGHYVPAVASAIYPPSADANDSCPVIKLTGIAIGNGLTNPYIQYQAYPTMIYNYSSWKLGQPLISLSEYQSMVNGMPNCLALIQACNNGNTEACESGMGACEENVMLPYAKTGRNVYDIRKMCDNPPLCYDFSAITTYLNDPTVQQQIGVNVPWEACNMQVNMNFKDDFLRGYQSLLPKLLQGGIEVLIYAGDCDFICNWIGNKAWTIALEWSGKRDFNAASDIVIDGVGEMRSAHGLTFFRIYNAGHMVPYDQPELALKMVEKFITIKKAPEMK